MCEHCGLRAELGLTQRRHVLLSWRRAPVVCYEMVGGPSEWPRSMPGGGGWGFSAPALRLPLGPAGPRALVLKGGYDTLPVHGAEPDPRVLFAAERTLLAWIRTGITLMAFGFVVARFGLFLRALSATSAGWPRESRLSIPIGVLLVLSGVIVNLAAGWEHARFRRSFFTGQPLPVTLGKVSIGLAVLLGAIGSVLTAHLVSLLPPG